MNKKIKQIIALSVLFVATVISVLAFQQKPEKTFNFKFTQGQVEVVWYVLDNSTASHNDVKAVQKWLSDQYSAQIDTTSKKK